jgi:hypothetical protein
VSSASAGRDREWESGFSECGLRKFDIYRPTPAAALSKNSEPSGACSQRVGRHVDRPSSFFNIAWDSDRYRAVLPGVLQRRGSAAGGDHLGHYPAEHSWPFEFHELRRRRSTHFPSVRPTCLGKEYFRPPFAADPSSGCLRLAS